MQNNLAKQVLYVRNLPLKISDKELYSIFSRFGAIRQIRKGNTVKTRGQGFVVYLKKKDAKKALEGLNGFKVKGKYLVCLFYY